MPPRAVLWAFAAVLLAIWPHRGVAAQDLAVAAKSPRFLYASSASAKPVEIDANRMAVFRQVVSLQVDAPTVGRILATIERQTGLTFVYGTDLRTERPVTLRAESITVGSALAAILYDAGLDVVLLPGQHVSLAKRGEPVASATGTIAGRVTDAKTQAALSGATVAVEGTRRSATTGNDGRYRIADVAPGTYTVRARYIGYAPATASVTVSADQEATADFGLEKSVQRLDEVVTTGTVVPTEVKALPTPISVITADDIQQQNLQRVDQLFRGIVPGAIAWDPGPNDYASDVYVRGVSTLSAGPAIKTFIDGVEMTQPGYVATIDPNSVDRIEITRGPQASTLYGAGALNGVMQIFTKKGRLGVARPDVTGKLSAGGVGGFSGQSTAFETDNAISIMGGGETTSYNLGGAYRRIGEWTPSYHSTDWSVSAGGQTTQGPLTLSSSLRYVDKAWDDPWITQLQSYTPFSKSNYFAEHNRQQTYGLTASVQANRSWQHTLTLGYDQSYLTGEQTQPRLTTPDDSFLVFSGTKQSKTSLLYHTDLSLPLATAMKAVMTAGVNYVAYDFVNAGSSNATRITGSLNGFNTINRRWSSNTGYFGQLQIGLAERLFLTGGLRAERDPDFGADFGTAWSPRAGVSYLLGLGPTTVKLRASYGQSIRPPAPGAGAAQLFPRVQYLANPNLAPERQRGVDGGVEVYLGRAFVGVTYYNQRAIDLIAIVAVPQPPGVLRTLQYQNVSRVKNEGWEFEGRLPLGPVQVAGTYSITNSTVQALPPGYPAGGYQVGDPILAIPHTSAGVTVTYSPLPQTTLTASMTHIGHWIEHDWLAEYGFIFGGQPYRGSDRAYWIEYPTVTKFAVGVSQQLRQGLTAFVRAENVGNNLRFENNNLSIPSPRSVLIGANVRL